MPQRIPTPRMRPAKAAPMRRTRTRRRQVRSDRVNRQAHADSNRVRLPVFWCLPAKHGARCPSPSLPREGDGFHMYPQPAVPREARSIPADGRLTALPPRP